jgi:hypothetical protein
MLTFFSLISATETTSVKFTKLILCAAPSLPGCDGDTGLAADVSDTHSAFIFSVKQSRKNHMTLQVNTM